MSEQQTASARVVTLDELLGRNIINASALGDLSCMTIQLDGGLMLQIRPDLNNEGTAILHWEMELPPEVELTKAV